jgi:hypothetical protein
MSAMGLPDASRLDFTRDNDETRQALYQLAVAHFWSPDQAAPGWSAGEDEPALRYTPQEAKLQVVFFACRWFAAYRAIEERGSSNIDDRRPLFRVTFDPTCRYGVHFLPC